MPLVDRFGVDITPRTRPALWRGKLGVNLTGGLGFVHTFDVNDFQTEYTSDTLSAIKAAGFDFVRIPFAPDYLLDAANDTIMAQRYEAVDAAIGECLSFGLKVFLNNQVWTLPDVDGDFPWSGTHILADYPNGTKWLRFLDLADLVAEKLLKYDPALVSYGQWNEAPGTYANWSAIVTALYNRIRQTNEQVTVFVSSDGYSGPDNVPNLDPSGIEGNARYAFTPYEPYLFALRAVRTVVPYDIPIWMNFPPIPSQKGVLITAIEANVDADTSVASPDKAAWKAMLEGFLDDYIDGRNGLEKTWLNRKLGTVVGWAESYQIDPADLIISEIGLSTNGGYGDTQRNSNMRWFAGMAYEAAVHGIGGICVHCYQAGTEFSISSPAGVLDDDYLVALGGIPKAAPSPRVAAMFSAQRASGPSAVRLRAQQAVAAADRRLQTLGLWAKLSLLYFSSGIADTADQSLYCWKNPRSNKLIVSGSPIFEPLKGWRSSTADGTDLLDTGYVCDYSDGIYTRNSNHFGIFQNDGFPADDFTKFIAGDDGQNYINLSPSSLVLGLSAAAGFNGVTATDDDFGTDSQSSSRCGHIIGVRESSSVLTAYKDGELIGTGISSASAAYNVLSGTVKLLRTSGGQLGGAHLGANLTSQDVTDLYTVFDFLRVALLPRPAWR